MTRAESYQALNGLMDDWYETIEIGVHLPASIGFESYMEARDWDGAKRSHGWSALTSARQGGKAGATGTCISTWLVAPLRTPEYDRRERRGAEEELCR